MSGFALPAGTSAADRHGVAVCLQKAFAKFDGDLKGTYYDLGTMTKEQSVRRLNFHARVPSRLP